MKLKSFFGLALFLIVLSASAQTAVSQPTLISTDQNVSLYYEPGTCGPRNVIYLHIVNENATTVTVTWTLWEDGKTKTLELKPNETVTGACQNRQPMFMLTEEIPAGKSINDMRPEIKVIVN